MASYDGPDPIVTDGLIFAADAGNTRCFISGASTCKDLIGGFTGTLQGAAGGIPVYNSDGGGSWATDGVDDEINFGTVTNVAGLAGTAYVTVGGWVKKDTSGDDCLFGAYTNTGPHGFALQWYTNGTLYFEVSSGALQYNSLSLTWADSWFYIVGVYDGTIGSQQDRAKIYVNGIKQTVSTTSGLPATLSSTVPEMIIGSMQNYSSWTDGKMTAVTIYNRSLTAAEVLQNYNSQKQRFGL